MTACSNCRRELPEGAFFCPGCGASAVDYSAAHTDISPSHFNSGITATSPPQTTGPPPPAADPGLAPYPPSPEEKRSRLAGRRGLVLAVIAILAVLLVGTTFETGMLGPGPAPAVNSPSDPLSGGQLYAAYAANLSQATASYTNKTVYIQDSLDAGVFMDNSGQYYSSVDSGNVILFWSSQSQLSGLGAGSMVLAKCSVNGEQLPPGAGYLGGALGPVVVLENCALVGTQSQSAPSVSVSQAYD